MNDLVAHLDLSAIFVDKIWLTPHYDTSSLDVLQAFSDELDPELKGRLLAMFEKYPFISDRIRDRFEGYPAFRQPTIILAYYLVSMKPHVVKQKWPLNLQDIEPVFTDLGKAL